MTPRASRTRNLFCFAVALGLSFVPEAELTAEPQPVVSAVSAIELTVRDLARSQAFFEQLGFEKLSERELAGNELEERSGLRAARARRVELALGTEHIALLAYAAPNDGRAVPSDTHGNDLWFQHIAIVVRDMDRADAWLKAQRVAHVSSAPQTLPAWNRGAAGIQAFYFADPEGHVLEIIHFPKGKGDPRWQAPRPCKKANAALCEFLGIDHTAITVSDTEQSLAFYRDRLGLTVRGESENYGFEQEHLNGVFGAHLRITALRAASGPGVELLEYLSPRGGRPMPADARVNDLFNWQVLMTTRSVPEALAATKTYVGRVAHAGAHHAVLRDRDGHALLVSDVSAP
jgi:catechol 2,3-dioxygenase-like lactoylglutathione lyase family enzyme